MSDSATFDLGGFQQRFTAAIELGEDGKETRAELADEFFEVYKQDPQLQNLAIIMQLGSYLARTDGLPESPETSILVKAFAVNLDCSQNLKDPPKLFRLQQAQEQLCDLICELALLEANKKHPDYRKISNLLYPSRFVLPNKNGMIWQNPPPIIEKLSQTAADIAESCWEKTDPFSSCYTHTARTLPLRAVSDILFVAGDALWGSSTRAHLPERIMESMSLRAETLVKTFHYQIDYEGFFYFFDRTATHVLSDEYKKFSDESERSLLDRLGHMAESVREVLMTEAPRSTVTDPSSAHYGCWVNVSWMYNRLRNLEEYADHPALGKTDHFKALETWCLSGTTDIPPTTAFSFSQILEKMPPVLKLSKESKPVAAKTATSPAGPRSSP